MVPVLHRHHTGTTVCHYGTIIEDASGGDPMANKDKGGKSTKKAASRSLKEKRQAKKAKKAGGS
jgi:hypothetical protein